MTRRNTTRFRIALAMRGGVSLAVCIGGAVHEIDVMRRSVGDSGDHDDPLVDDRRFWHVLLDQLGYGGVDVDVFTGASAGGLNGAIYAASLRTGRPLDPLRDVWLNDADLAVLLHHAGSNTSLLDGQYFYDRILATTQAFFAPPVDDFEGPTFDLQLTATLLRGIEVSSSEDPAAPVREHRSTATIHYRHRGEPTDLPLDDPMGPDSSAARLATGARSTASFPFAFEPWPIGPDGLKGILKLGATRPNHLALFDGGVVDNMPVGRAVQAIDESPAGTATKRWLLYLHPSPGGPSPATTDAPVGRTFADVVRGLMGSVQSKSLVDDLRALAAHNDRVSDQRRERSTLLEALPCDAALVAPVPGRARADDETAQLCVLLEQPNDHLRWTLEAHDEPSPFASWTSEQRLVLVGEIGQRLSASDVPTVPDLPSLARGSMYPLSPVIRVASLLIEAIGAIEDAGVRSDTCGAAKRRAYALRQKALVTDAELNLRTITGVKPDRTGPRELAEDLLAARRAGLEEATEQAARLWRKLAEVLLSLDLDLDLLRTDDRLAAKLVEVLAAADGSVVDAGHGLDRIDLALQSLHQGALLGSLDQIRFRTLAGTSPTPFADPDGSGLNGLPRLQRLGPVEGAHVTSAIDPATKLAGNQFHNFAAFLKRSWRANDWMWGRIDAATCLIDVLLRDVPDHIVVAAAAELAGSPEPIAGAWDENDWHEPAVARQLLIAQRHAEILDAELSRTEDNPSGGSPAGSFVDRLEQYDRAKLRLGDDWGSARLAAFGQRGAAVGWRSAFQGLALPLRFLGLALAPLPGSLAGIYLARRRGLLVIAGFLAAVVVPRCHDHLLGRWLAAMLGVAVVLGGILLTRDGPSPRGAPPRSALQRLAGPQPLVTLILVGTLALLVVEAIAGWPASPTVDEPVSAATYVFPSVAMAFITWVSWYWAKVWARLLATAFVASTIYLWTALAASGPDRRVTVCAHDISDAAGWFGSMWWGLALILYVTSIASTRIDLVSLGPER